MSVGICFMDTITAGNLVIGVEGLSLFYMQYVFEALSEVFLSNLLPNEVKREDHLVNLKICPV